MLFAYKIYRIISSEHLFLFIYLFIYFLFIYFIDLFISFIYLFIYFEIAEIKTLKLLIPKF